MKSVIDWVGHDIKVTAKNDHDFGFDDSDQRRAIGRGENQERKKQRKLCKTEKTAETARKKKPISAGV